jgi:hypothetical protein
MLSQFYQSNRKTILSLLLLACVLGAMLVLSDDGLLPHFNYSFF